MTLGTERSERVQRRTALQERAMSAVQETSMEKRQPGAPTSVDTVTLETGEIRTMTVRTSMNLILGGFTFSSRGRSASAVSGTDGSPGEVGRGGDDAPRDGEDGVVASANENQDVDLKTVKAEVRRQAVTVGTKWRDDQLYHEVASHLDGESKR
ncbi:hypothetical protein PInf_017794 [Phytophthora infestans]|nr:hypothetical protein PInf_017794 [Phytophthora infestans]